MNKKDSASSPAANDSIYVDILKYIYNAGIDGISSKSFYLDFLNEKQYFSHKEKYAIQKVFKYKKEGGVQEVIVGTNKEFEDALGDNEYTEFHKQEIIKPLNMKIRAINDYFENITTVVSRGSKGEVIRAITNESVHRYLEFQELELAREQAVNAKKYSTYAIFISFIALIVSVVQLGSPTKIKDVVKTAVETPVKIDSEQIKGMEEKLNNIELKLEDISKGQNGE